MLAAGRGTRFGGGKLEAMCAGKPLGRWVIEAVEEAGLGPGMIVTGPEGVSFAEGWTALINPQPGGGAWFVAGARCAARSTRADALLVLLADMPLVDAGLPARAGCARRTCRDAPARRACGRSGAARSYVDGAGGVLAGDRGAGPLLLVRAARSAAGMLRDVDTPEDLADVERVLAA